MKLPGGAFEQGRSSLGRETHDPTSVSRAEFQAATALGEIAKALAQSSEVAETWALAQETSTANKNKANYHAAMTETATELTKSPYLPASAAEGFLKTGDERTVVPTWEVAPAIYEKKSKEEAAKALKDIKHRPTREATAASLQEFHTRQSAQIAAFALDGRKNQMIGDSEQAIQTFVKTGTLDGRDAAKSVVAGMVQSGLITPKQGVDRNLKIDHDVTDLGVAKQLTALTLTEDIPGLDRFSVDVYRFDVLSADERRAYSNSAKSAADGIYKRREADEAKAQREASKQILGTLATRIRLEGYIPSSDELKNAKEKLSGADYLSLIAMIDRKDGNKGIVTDKAEYSALSKLIIGLSYPDSTGVPVIWRADNVYDRIMTAYSRGKLEDKDREELVGMWERYRDRPLNKSPEYTQAEEKIDANLSIPKGFIASLSLADQQKWASVSTEMKLGLADAVRMNPKLDPRAWVNQNLPRFRAMAGSLAYDRLYKDGLGMFAVLRPDGTLDQETSRQKVRDAVTNGLLAEGLAKKAFNALALGDARSTNFGEIIPEKK